MSKIVENKIKCNLCGDIVISKHRHDFVYCSCKRVAADGGKDYLKRTFTSANDYEELSSFDDGPILIRNLKVQSI